MMKRKCACKAFSITKIIDSDIEEYVNRFSSLYLVSDVKMEYVSKTEQVLVTVLYEVSEKDVASCVPSDKTMYTKVINFWYEEGIISINSTQQEFGIGFNRASEIIRVCEDIGIVSPKDKNNKRSLLLSREEALSRIDKKVV